jgi:hypothetical protein
VRRIDYSKTSEPSPYVRVVSGEDISPSILGTVRVYLPDWAQQVNNRLLEDIRLAHKRRANEMAS